MSHFSQSAVLLLSVLALGAPGAEQVALRPGLPAALLQTAGREHRGNSCGAGRDLIVQALERLRADSGRDQVAAADELLKRATDLCSEIGDAWYFRSLVETRLGNKPKADFALGKARFLESESLHEGVDPFVLATPQPGKAPPPGRVRERWALIIGVGQFTDKKIEPLEFSTNDAQAFRDLLVDARVGGFKAENVRLLTNQDATLKGIKSSLNWLARSAAPDDLVVVYVATHGSARDLDTAGANYLITNDTEVFDPNKPSGQDPDALYATALPMVELSNAIATRIRSRRIAVFLDTCYSGGVAEASGKMGTAVAAPANPKLIAPNVRGASVSRATLEQISQGTGRVVLAAANSNQESLESEELKHGYFTYYLIQELRSHPTEPLSQIFASVRQQVSGRVAQDRPYNDPQTPVMSRSADDTDFALGVDAGTASAALANPGWERR